MASSLPPIASVPHSPDAQLTHILDLLFEPSPPLHALSLPVLRSTTFPSYAVLIAAINTQLADLAHSSAPDDVTRLSEILCSHPRLGAAKVESEQSRREQAQLAGGGAGDEGAKEKEKEKEMLGRLNEEYEARFPGLRYVYVLFFLFLFVGLWFLIQIWESDEVYSVFVNGRARPAIMENMRTRIDRGDISAERQEAIQAMCDIALDRAGKLQS